MPLDATRAKMDDICEIFEHDPRPTFLVDFYEHEPHIAFCNQALRHHDGLLDTLSITDSASSKFRSWWVDQGADESHRTYKGFLWTKFTARKRWLVVCCLQTSHMVGSPCEAVPDVSLPLRNGEGVEQTTRRQHEHSRVAKRGAKNESIFNTTHSLSPELARHIEYIRKIDWSKTSLGPIETWSHDLCQLLTLMMLETRPTAAFLGPDHVMLYNLGYVAITGKRHPGILGKRVTDAWPEVADVARKTIAETQETHQADLTDKEYHLFLERSGFLEEAFFMWALVPLVGPVVGLYSIVTEVTKERYPHILLSIVVPSSAPEGKIRVGFVGVVPSSVHETSFEKKTIIVLFTNVFSPDIVHDESLTQFYKVMGKKNVRASGRRSIHRCSKRHEVVLASYTRWYLPVRIRLFSGSPVFIERR